MKMAIVVFVTGILFALPCRAGAACPAMSLPESVEVGSGGLSLADLLPAGACPELYRAAAGVTLGAAPRAGSERVLDGREIWRQLEQIENREGNGREMKSALMRTPERIVVRLAGSRKSCAEVADFLARARAAQRLDNHKRWREELNCGGAGNIPENAALELTRTNWDPALRRWEFALRCARAGQCVPFLVWARGSNAAGGLVADASPGAPERQTAVKRGQTATLTWDEAGIRIVLPVTCLEAGRIGQSVLVRFENAARRMRAEVVGTRMLRASL